MEARRETVDDGTVDRPAWQCEPRRERRPAAMPAAPLLSIETDALREQDAAAGGGAAYAAAIDSERGVSEEGSREERSREGCDCRRDAVDDATVESECEPLRECMRVPPAWLVAPPPIMQSAEIEARRELARDGDSGPSDSASGPRLDGSSMLSAGCEPRRAAVEEVTVDS